MAERNLIDRVPPELIRLNRTMKIIGKNLVVRISDNENSMGVSVEHYDSQVFFGKSIARQGTK